MSSSIDTDDLLSQNISSNIQHILYVFQYTSPCNQKE